MSSGNKVLKITLTIIAYLLFFGGFMNFIWTIFLLENKDMLIINLFSIMVYLLLGLGVLFFKRKIS